MLPVSITFNWKSKFLRLVCPLQKARPLGTLLFEMSKLRLQNFCPRAENQTLQAMFSLLAGQLCKMNFIAGHLSGLWNSGNFRLNLTKTAFNLEWAPNIIVRRRFELRPEKPTKAAKPLSQSGGGFCIYRRCQKLAFVCLKEIQKDRMSLANTVLLL